MYNPFFGGYHPLEALFRGLISQIVAEARIVPEKSQA